jgi:hypothetical protein
MIGWNLSWNKDIRFVWNGINNSGSDNINVIGESDNIYTGRGQSSLSFITGIVFKTEPNVSLVAINPVNYFNQEFETMSSLISTSWFDNDFPLAIKAKIPNKEILIKAGQPLATIIPISLTSLDNTSIDIYDYLDENGIRRKNHESYGQASQEINQRGEWTDWYRDAVNEKNETLGKHETKALRLSVTDKRKMV